MPEPVDLPFELVVRHRGFSWRGILEPTPESSDASLQELVREASAFRERTLREARPDGAPTPGAPTPAAPTPSAPTTGSGTPSR